MARWQPEAAARLTAAAVTLFDERGYDQTTVADIAAAAGLTKRTFFRHFADKREVLFHGSHELVDHWVAAVSDAPASATPMTAVGAGLAETAELFADRHELARIRNRIIEANPELRERELIKLQTLAGAIATALTERGVPRSSAVLAAQAGVTVFHVGFVRWVAQDDASALPRMLDEALVELRSVTTA